MERNALFTLTLCLMASNFFFIQSRAQVPQITAVSPHPACRGARIAVSGTGLHGVTLIQVDGIPVPPISQQANLLLLDLPASLPVNDSLELLLISPADTTGDSLFIAYASPDFQAPQSLCPGDQLALSGIFPAGGTWTYGSGFSFVLGQGQVATTPGIYPVSYRVQNSAGCTDSLTRWVQISEPDTAGFYYPGTLYCTLDPSPLPVLTGDGGGYFFDSTGNGLMIDSLTGRVSLQSSNWFSHLAGYVSGGACPDTASALIRIFPQGNANFSYPFSSYCLSSSQIPIPQRIDTNGAFFGPSGRIAFADSTTGQIDLSGSLPGDSIAVYHAAPGLYGGCPDTALFYLSLLRADTSISLSYSGSFYCPDEPNPLPQVTGPGGGFFSAVPGGLTFVSAATGEIDLNQTAPNTYRISYRVQNTCSDTTTSFELSVGQKDDPTFTYPIASICENAPFPAPSFIASPGGTFSGSLVFADSLGTVDLTASASGNHLLTYTTSGACSDSLSVGFNILPAPEPILVAEGDTSLCEGEHFPLTLLGASTFAERIFSVEGQVVQRSYTQDSYLWKFPKDAETVTATLIEGNGCKASDSLTVSVAKRPKIVSLEYPKTLSEQEQLQIEVRSDADSTRYRTVFYSGANVLPKESRQLSSRYGAIAPALIKENFDLESPREPGRLLFGITTEIRECIGDSVSGQVIILPASSPVFVPELITPNGDGLNDLWEIAVADSLSPADFSLSLFNEGGGLVVRLSPLLPWTPTVPDGIYWWTLHQQGSLLKKGGLTILSH